MPAPASTAARVFALGVALVLAKLCVVVLRATDGIAPPLSPWSPFVLVYQDAWLVLVFLGLDFGTCKLSSARWAQRGLFVLGLALVAYAAINVPVARLFSTPLTASMLAAVGGALTDSATAQLTPGNVVAMLVPLVAYVWLALKWEPPIGARRILLGVAIAFSLIGPLVAAQVPTRGVHRNALVGLIETAFAGAPSAPDSGPETDAPLPSHGPALDLTSLAGSARGKNVLVIVLESHAARHLRPWSPSLPFDPTPNLTRALEHAVLFDRISTPYPESIKGFFAYLCSQVPLPNADAERHAAKNHRARCLSQTLGAAGYATALFHSGHFAYLGMKHVIADRGFDLMRDALQTKGPFMSSFGTDDRETARGLLAWTSSLPATRPFFAMFLPIAGHHPYHAPGDAPRPFPEASDQDAYYNDLHVGDAATGILLDGLRAQGRLDDTLIVVFGDHGQAFQEHPGNFAHTLFLYEENLHVPFAIIPPGALAGAHLQQRAPQRGSLVDLAPTVHALVGLPPDRLFEGRSLLEPSSAPVVSFTDHRALQFALRTSDARGDWKLILEGARAELYDLATDPGEQRDLAGSDGARETAARLTRFLTQWHALHYRRFLAADADPGEPPHQ